MKLDQHLFPTGIFVVVQFDDDVGDACAKKVTNKIIADGNFGRFLQEVSV